MPARAFRVNAVCPNEVDTPMLQNGVSSCADFDPQSAIEELGRNRSAWPRRWSRTTLPRLFSFSLPMPPATCAERWSRSMAGNRSHDALRRKGGTRHRRPQRYRSSAIAMRLRQRGRACLYRAARAPITGFEHVCRRIFRIRTAPARVREERCQRVPAALDMCWSTMQGSCRRRRWRTWISS